MIGSGYLGNSSKFEEAIASFAVTYANQNKRDHQVFLVFKNSRRRLESNSL